jgi:hypothetical protein
MAGSIATEPETLTSDSDVRELADSDRLSELPSCRRAHVSARTFVASLAFASGIIIKLVYNRILIAYVHR